jgi:hypothetical protein
MTESDTTQPVPTDSGPKGSDAGRAEYQQRLPDRTFDPITGLAAIALPGLGHAMLGERHRAAIVSTGIVTLALAGILIGGIGAVDSQGSRGWFLAQIFLGPATLAIDFIHQSRFHSVGALGRAEELGTLYVAIAGLLNLIAIIDAFLPRVTTPRVRERLAAASEAEE